jgi:hypothetical protein
LSFVEQMILEGKDEDQRKGFERELYATENEANENMINKLIALGVEVA